MSEVLVPNFINRVAQAGSAGLSMDDRVKNRDDLELCRNWGYPIRMRSGRAYLEADPDLLVPDWIENETPKIAWQSLSVVGFLEVGSTNSEALDAARRGVPAGLLIYAEKQTAGRGRKGRRWVSSVNQGLYCSLLLRPRQPMDRWPLLTLVTSIALARALEELSKQDWIPQPLEVTLKWPNDVLLSGKKTAGILLETAGVAETRYAAVVGIGINVGYKSFPEELARSATSVSVQAGVRVPRRHLLVRFLYFFQLAYDQFERGKCTEILEGWKRYSTMWSDTPIWIVEGNSRRPAVTCGLSEIGALKIRTPGGTEETLLAGDVSIRC